MSTPTLSHWLKVTVPAALHSFFTAARKRLHVTLHVINYHLLVALHFLHLPVASKTLAKYQEEREFANILNGVPEKDRQLYEILLHNQKKYEASRAVSSNQEPVSFVGVAKNMLDNLTARHFVGCQPMTGPVGLVYLLRYVAGEENEDGTKKMTLNVESRAVEARSREFNTKWTITAAQDLKAMHDTDLQKEMEYVTGLEMATETNEAIIDHLHEISHKEDVAKMKDDVELIIHINRACNEIGRRTRRGAGNFIIVDAPTLTRIENVANRNSSPRDMFVPAQEEQGRVGSVLFAGTLNNTIKVYVSLFHEDKILVGYKGGHGETDAGVYFAPYVLVMPTGPFIDSTTFNPMMKLLTRHGSYVDEKSSDYYVTLNLPKSETLSDK